MDDNIANEETVFLAIEEGKKDPDVAIRRRFRITNDNGEHSLNMIIVIEDFRAGFYLSFIGMTLIGVVLTKSLTKEDYNAVLTRLYGGSNLCAYYDFAPSIYVLPALYGVPLILGFLYNLAAIFRIKIAFLESKLTQRAYILLVVTHMYVVLSMMAVCICLAVQPNPANPETMRVHTIPYVNLKIAFSVLQVAVVYFGVKVSWIGLKLPRWFRIMSIAHVIPLIINEVAGTIWIMNALGDMGEKNLEGKGLWWSVRTDANLISGQIIVNILGFILHTLFPLFQSLFISRKGANTHALIVDVSDNRVSASSVCQHGQHSA